MSRLLVLKLGGSLLTDKMRPYSLRTDVLKAASAEVAACLRDGVVEKLVIVHGVGSYGHPPVIEHKLYKGFMDKAQLLPLSRTQSKVNELRSAIISSLQDEGVPVNLFHTSSIASAERGSITSMSLDAVKGFLKVGMVPVLGGDMVSDTEIGFSVGGGDQVAAILATELEATDLVFATDVAGVYDSDPKKNPGARLIPELSLSDLGGLSASSMSGDASGAMKGKLGALADLTPELQRGMKISIISMMEPGRLCGLLQGEPVKATIIRP
jgi:isopentenyl phosphate kinase